MERNQQNEEGGRTSPYPFEGVTPIIGMVHLQPLPGSMYFDTFDAVLDAALSDAWILANAGYDGLIVENYGDIPFRRGRVEAHTVAAMTAIAWEIKREVEIPLGLNVLRNDPFSAIAIASAVSASFIRVNVLSGAMVTDQGIIEGEAAEIIPYLDRVAPQLAIYADVNVKHAAPLVKRPLEEVAQETMYRNGAHALIVTGSQTGKGVDRRELEKVRQSVLGPVLIGSGVTHGNVGELIEECDGLIVGSSIKNGGDAGNPVDQAKAAELIRAARG